MHFSTCDDCEKIVPLFAMDDSGCAFSTNNNLLLWPGISRRNVRDVIRIIQVLFHELFLVTGLWVDCGQSTGVSKLHYVNSHSEWHFSNVTKRWEQAAFLQLWRSNLICQGLLKEKKLRISVIESNYRILRSKVFWFCVKWFSALASFSLPHRRRTTAKSMPYFLWIPN